MVFSVYLAGKVPKGVSEQANYSDWRESFVKKCAELCDLEIKFLNPNQGDWSMPIEKYFGRDVDMIHRSNALVLDATIKVGAGTAQEILIAKYYNKPVITVIPRDSHNDKMINTQNHGTVRYRHPFLTETSDLIVQSFDEAAEALVNHFTGEGPIKTKTIDCINDSRKEFIKYKSKKDTN